MPAGVCHRRLRSCVSCGGGAGMSEKSDRGEWIGLVGGKTLGGWKGRTGGGKGGAEAPDHTWKVVGGVRLYPGNEKLLVGVEGPGTGVLLNGDDGRTSDIHTELLHADCELHIEFCVAAKSNSG